jgi:hypothetical protein
MVCEPLWGVVAHARFQRHIAAHLAILHGGVTLQTRSSINQHLASSRNTALLYADYGENDSDAAALMLCKMGQDILLLGTAMAWRTTSIAAAKLTQREDHD